MVKFLLWLILLVICWPLGLIALVLYPFVWLLLLPFRMIGIALDGILELLKVLFLLPAKIAKSFSTALSRSGSRHSGRVIPFFPV